MGHSRTPAPNTAGDSFPADPIDGSVCLSSAGSSNGTGSPGAQSCRSVCARPGRRAPWFVRRVLSQASACPMADCVQRAYTPSWCRGPSDAKHVMDLGPALRVQVPSDNGCSDRIRDAERCPVLGVNREVRAVDKGVVSEPRG